MITLQPARCAPVVVRDDVPPEACARYLASHPDATAYHHPDWLAVVGDTFGHRTRYLVAEGSSGIVGVLPLVLFASRLFGRFAVSMPFVNYGGVVADDPDVERALLRRAVEETTRAGGTYLELRHTRQRFPALAARRHKVSMELALQPSPDRQWQALDRKVRNQVRKAEKSGLTVEHGGVERLPAFYRVFARNMRDLGTPVHGAEFFRHVLGTFPRASRVFVVMLGDRPVAASLVHWHGGVIEVPWASAIRDYNPLCANVLLYWHMLRFAADARFRTFDFGRSTPGEGTYHFKRQWGAEPRPLVWEYWLAAGQSQPNLSPTNPTFALAIRAWQRLPVRIATVLGPRIVRSIP